jgi:Ca2+-binding RTX toxin-like protein
VTASGSSAGGTYAHFKVLVDGKVVGEATTSSSSQVYSFDTTLDLTQPHAIAIQYDNDAIIDGADRNLFISSLQLDGTTLPLTGSGVRYVVSSDGVETVRSFSGAMPWNGSLIVDAPATASLTPPPETAPITSGVLVLRVTGDQWKGAPQFVVLVDGKQVGGIQTATARRASGEWQEISIAGEFDANPSKVEVKFINDASGGRGKDRNLYVDWLELNGKRYEGEAASNTASAGATNPTAAVMAVNGTLTFTTAPTAVTSSISRTLSTLEQDLTLTGTSPINGTGNSLANSLTGNSADNVLDGGAGADRMAGGAGNDTYIVDNVGDVVIEVSGGGFETVKASVSYGLTAEVENLVLTGSAAINGTGNGLDNKITGNTASNVLDGGAGNDILDGGAGSDMMRGGIGNDTYVVENAGDLVVELAAEGVDTVQAAISYALTANVENLVLVGSAAINGTGNALDNKIVGNGADNILDGGAGNDTLEGSAGNDRLEGGLGTDSALFSGNAADYRVTTSGGLTTITALKGSDGVDTLSGIEKLIFADKAVDLAALSPPTQESPVIAEVKLTRYDGMIRTSYDGQVIENLDIYSSGTAIQVLNKNVIIRNVRVHHADGDGIYANGAHNLTIEGVEVINTDPPIGQSPEESDTFNNIEIVNSADVTIHNVTVRDGSTGIYLVGSPRAEIDHVDGYDFHGPFPRGQFVQFNNSGDGTLTNFYVHNDVAHSHVEDIVNAYASPNVRIANGVIDGNNAPTGVAVMFEDGSTGGTVTNVDVIHQGNGAFSAYTADIHFIDVRSFDSIAYDQGRGLPSSGCIEFVVNGTGVILDDATYTRPGNPGNIIWQPVKPLLLDVKADPYAVAMSHDAFVNDWHWA